MAGRVGEDTVLGHLTDKWEELDTEHRGNFVVDKTGKKAVMVGKIEEDKGLQQQEEKVVDNCKPIVQNSMHGVHK